MKDENGTQAALGPSPKGQNNMLFLSEHVVRRLNQLLFCGAPKAILPIGREPALECAKRSEIILQSKIMTEGNGSHLVSAFRAPTGSDALQGATRNPLQHSILAAEGLLFRAQPRNKPRPFPEGTEHWSMLECCSLANMLSDA
jgi:hypothetical protein